jgi:hypothetical protein
LSRVIVLLAFSIFLNYADRSTLSIAATLLKKDLGLSALQFGILLSSFCWMSSSSGLSIAKPSEVVRLASARVNNATTAKPGLLRSTRMP